MKDTDSLAEEIRKMTLLTPEERVEMGRKGREKVIAEFDERLVIEKYRHAITDLLNN